MLASCDIIGGSSVSYQMGVANPGNLRDTTPVVLQADPSGVAVMDNEKATLDYSNTSEGYICVKSKLNGIKVKVLVVVDGSQYQYTIIEPERYITIPLSCGNGTYQVGVYENIKGDSYSPILSHDLNVSLADEFRPFLYPNQYVDFTDGDMTTQISQQSATGATSDVEALYGIYDYVIKNVTYDYDKAASVQPGYLPTNADTISTGQGICFDFAVLAASMLRGQGIPAKLVIGYSDAAYHAWIQVYCTDTGKVLAAYTFNGTEWVRMDPTFDAARKGILDLSGLIGSGTTYQPMLFY
jgi:transglutaminase-like putative cysteine protease